MSYKTPCARRSSLFALLSSLSTLLTLTLWIGCDSTGDHLKQAASDDSQSGSQRWVNSSISPRTLIEQAVSAYQQLHSYQDDAYVRLQYDLDDKRLEDRAPLSIAWDDHGNLGMRVYSVEAGPSGGRWRLRLPDAQAFVPHQVLSRAKPAKVDFAWLLSDSLVAERLAAGLAGFPPQLDLLLAPKPLQGLIDDTAALSFGHPQSIDGKACFVIHVQRAASEFVLWIDQESLLLRRLRLPRSHLTEQMIEDVRISNVNLTIEFAGARGNTDIDWERFAVANEPNELRVNHFVPAPSLVDTSGLGDQVPGFHLESPEGATVYDSSTASTAPRKATVLLWLADHPTCRMACEQMQRIAATLPSLGVPKGAVEFVMVWAEPQPAAGSTFANLAEQWKMPGSLALDNAAMGRDLFNVQEAPTFVVIDQNNRLQLRESRSNPLLDQVLPQLLKRLVAGEDLAGELLQQQTQLVSRHRAEQQMAAAMDASQTGDLTSANSYKPETFTLRELTRSPSKATAIAVNGDAQGTVWTLYNTGQMRRDTASTVAMPDPQAWLNTRWRVESAESIARIEGSPASKYVAFSTTESTAVQWMDCDTEENRTISLPSAARPTDLRWLPGREGTAARLAVLTADGQTLLIDPSDRQQLSGRSPVTPMALLPARPQESGIAGHAVLADRSIQPLQLTEPNRSDATVANSAAGSEPSQDLLAFQPNFGPWSVGRDSTGEWILARGWLAEGEPALFLLDELHKQRWHYRMPLQPEPSLFAYSVAVDPTSGQTLWTVLSGIQTVHVLRADGRIIDHFCTDESIVGLALQPNGARLELSIVHPSHAIRYAMDWRPSRNR